MQTKAGASRLIISLNKEIDFGYFWPFLDLYFVVPVPFETWSNISKVLHSYTG